jgi:hypothetical protein
VRRQLFDVAVFIVLATVVAAVLAWAGPSIRSIVLHVYVLTIGATLLVALLAAIGHSVPSSRRSAFDAALGDRPKPADSLPQLERLEREVTLSVSTAYDLHLRLLPTLREIAQARLESAGRSPGPETLGRWWELLRPDRAAPENRFAPGISARDLRALVDDLARIPR